MAWIPCSYAELRGRRSGKFEEPFVSNCDGGSDGAAHRCARSDDAPGPMPWPHRPFAQGWPRRARTARRDGGGAIGPRALGRDRPAPLRGLRASRAQPSRSLFGRRRGARSEARSPGGWHEGTRVDDSQRSCGRRVRGLLDARRRGWSRRGWSRCVFRADPRPWRRRPALRPHGARSRPPHPRWLPALLPLLGARAGGFRDPLRGGKSERRPCGRADRRRAPTERGLRLGGRALRPREPTLLACHGRARSPRVRELHAAAAVHSSRAPRLSHLLPGQFVFATTPTMDVSCVLSLPRSPVGNTGASAASIRLSSRMRSILCGATSSVAVPV